MTKRIISLILASTMIFTNNFVVCECINAKEKEQFNIESICVTDEINIDTKNIVYDGSRFSKRTFADCIQKQAEFGNRDNFILHNYFMKDGVNEESKINIDNESKINNAQFSDTSINIENAKELNVNIGALKDIMIKGEDINSRNIILYSQSGDIKIKNSSNINFEGIIYAPNGIIEISSKNFNMNGTMLAKNIKINSDVVNINNESMLSSFVMSQPELEDTQVGDYCIEYDAFGKTDNIICDGNSYVKYYYTDDLNHKLSKIQYANGDSEDYYYNQEGKLTGISSNGKRNYEIAYEYNTDGEVSVKYDYRNNRKTCYIGSLYKVYKIEKGEEIFLYEKEIDPEEALSDSVQPDVVVHGTDLIHTYKLNQNQTKEKYRLKGWGDIFEIQKEGKKVSYTYDDKRQLVCVDDEINKQSYECVYDSIGNIRGKNTYKLFDSGQKNLLYSDTYKYDLNYKDRLIEFNDRCIQYDQLGNPIQYGNMSMSWEHGRRLTEIKDSYNNIQYLYDDVCRLGKVVNGVATEYRYINGTVSEQTDGHNTLVFNLDKRYEYSGFVLNGKEYKYVKNLLGDIIAIEDKKGSFVCGYEYDPWGNIIKISGEQMIAKVNPIRYRGYYFDEETGFYYLGSRYYDPETARFINADEYWLCIDNNKNMYKYCDNNPICYVDDSGYYSMHNSHYIEYVKDEVYKYINNKTYDIPDDAKYLIAIVDGEAEGENSISRRAVASVIVNRTVSRKRSLGSFYSTVSWSFQFSSYGGSLYTKCMRYLNNRTGKNSTYEAIIGTSLKVGYRIVKDITKGCLMFYSPKSMVPRGSVPPWVKGNEEVKIKGINSNNFRFYKHF